MPDGNSIAGSIDPRELHSRLVKLGEEWAEAEAAAQLLEETRKSVLGEIFQRKVVHMSATAAEHVARATEDYRDHIKAMVEARHEANKRRVRYDSAKVFIDLLRSQHATRREELRQLGVA